MAQINSFPSEWRRGIYEAIARRRDIRSFRPDPIPPEVLARMLFAAHHAGSVGFSQPWNFLLVEDLELRRRIHAHVDAQRLRAASAFDQARREQYLSFKLEGILDAPLNICVTCDRTRFGPGIIGRNTVYDTDIYSACVAVQNLWLAARAEGIGVGWVSILKPEVIQEILGIPEHVIVVAYLCVGYPVEFTERPLLETAGWLPRLKLSELVFGDHWNEPPRDELSQALSGMDERLAPDGDDGPSDE
jgi:5,6-dimethylbenzimidazole synthase